MNSTTTTSSVTKRASQKHVESPAGITDAFCADGSYCVLSVPAMTKKLVDFQEWLISNEHVSWRTAHLYFKCVDCWMKDASSIDMTDCNQWIAYLVWCRQHRNKVYPRNLHAVFAMKKWALYLFGKTHKAWVVDLHEKIEGLEPEFIRVRQKEFKELDAKVKEQVITSLKTKQWQLIARLQAATGCRAGDIMRLHRGDVRFDEDSTQRIVMVLSIVGKGGKKHTVWLFDHHVQVLLEEFIKTNITGTDYYFLPKTTTHIESEVEQQVLKYIWALRSACAKCGLKKDAWSTHDWRRSAANHVWRKYKDIILLKQFMNHADINTTARYIEANKLRVKDALLDLHEERVRTDEQYADKQL